MTVKQAIAANRPCRPGGCVLLCTEQGMIAAYTAYRGRLLARARRVVIDPALAEEAVQEAFVRAWQACASFDPAGGPLVNWLLVITGNVAIDLVKARVRRPRLASVPVEEASAERPDPGGIEQLLQRAHLRHALSRIDDRHRHAVVETLLRDRPYADVAAELGIPTGTLRTRVHYGLRRLREVLDPVEAAA